MTTDKQRIHSWLLIKKELWWIYVIVLSRTSFRVNPPSIVCLNGKELLSQNRRLIWSLSDSNEIWTHNHLVRERKLNHLAKLALTGWVLVYKLNDCRFESRCCHLNSDECLKMFRRKVSQWFCKFKFCEIFMKMGVSLPSSQVWQVRTNPVLIGWRSVKTTIYNAIKPWLLKLENRLENTVVYA